MSTMWDKVRIAYDGKPLSFLKLYVNEENQELVDLYTKHVEQHNTALLDETYPNSGFDVFVPSEVEMAPVIQSKLIDLQIKAEMLSFDNVITSLPYFMFPRSSLSKTPLMLANHTGIIDASYRGFLMGAFRNLDSRSSYTIEKHTRLLQICDTKLGPIYVELVSEKAFSKTTRGIGGFGSTGFVGLS